MGSFYWVAVNFAPVMTMLTRSPRSWRRILTTSRWSSPPPPPCRTTPPQEVLRLITKGHKTAASGPQASPTAGTNQAWHLIQELPLRSPAPSVTRSSTQKPILRSTTAKSTTRTGRKTSIGNGTSEEISPQVWGVRGWLCVAWPGARLLLHEVPAQVGQVPAQVDQVPSVQVSQVPAHIKYLLISNTCSGGSGEISSLPSSGREGCYKLPISSFRDFLDTYLDLWRAHAHKLFFIYEWSNRMSK